MPSVVFGVSEAEFGLDEFEVAVDVVEVFDCGTFFWLTTNQSKTKKKAKTPFCNKRENNVEVQSHDLVVPLWHPMAVFQSIWVLEQLCICLRNLWKKESAVLFPKPN